MNGYFLELKYKKNEAKENDPLNRIQWMKKLGKTYKHFIFYLLYSIVVLLLFYWQIQNYGNNESGFGESLSSSDEFNNCIVS